MLVAGCLMPDKSKYISFQIQYPETRIQYLFESSTTTYGNLTFTRLGRARFKILGHGDSSCRLKILEKTIYFDPKKLKMVAATMPSKLDKMYHGLLPIPAYSMNRCIIPMRMPNPNRQITMKEI